MSSIGRALCLRCFPVLPTLACFDLLWSVSSKGTPLLYRMSWENRMGGFRKGGFSNSRFVLKPDVAIASEVSILSKNSLAITGFHAKKTQHDQLFENPLPGNPPHSRFPDVTLHVVCTFIQGLVVLQGRTVCAIFNCLP